MKNLIIALFLLGSINLMAQSNRQYISLSAGAAFPMNDFAKAQLTDTASGFAKTGINIKLLYSYKVTHNFGIQTHFIFNSNNIDLQSIRNEAIELIPDYSFSIESSQAWSTGGVYVSPFLRFPITEKLTWEIKGDIGITGAYSPQFTIRGSKIDTQEKTEYFRNSDKAFGLGLGGGTSILYQLSKYKICLNFDYLYSDLKFKEISGWGWTSPSDPDGTPYNTSANRNITVASVSIGLAYSL